MDRTKSSKQSINHGSDYYEYDWPIEIYERYTGDAKNITLHPGEMLLYESSTLLLGRPYSYKSHSTSYAEIHIHYEPISKSLLYNNKSDNESSTTKSNINSSSNRNENDHSNNIHDTMYYPPYMVHDFSQIEQQQQYLTKDQDPNGPTTKDTPPSSIINMRNDEATSAINDATLSSSTISNTETVHAIDESQQQYEYELNNNELRLIETQFAIEEDNCSMRSSQQRKNKKGFVSHAAHIAAAMGDLESIHKLGRINKYALRGRDENGWQPIHEAVRGSQLKIIQVLIEQYDVDVNARVGYQTDNDQTPLSIAILLGNEQNQYNNNIIEYLQTVGAKLVSFRNDPKQQQGHGHSASSTTTSQFNHEEL